MTTSLPPLLVRLGLRRSGPWEPPSVLDRLLTSPLGAVAFFLWRALSAGRRFLLSISSSPFSLLAPPVRVVCISDTHSLLVRDLPAGDLLIHAGDLTNAGTPADLQKQLDWLASQPHRHKVVIAGNHDTWFDPAARAAAGMASQAENGAPVTFPHALHYLEHSSVVLSFDQGRQLTVYGAPDIPRCGPSSFAFQYDRNLHPWKDLIPNGVDILITHTPPRHHCDLGIGCAGLLREIWRVRPQLHVCGHVHWGAGHEILRWDASQKAYEALLEETSSNGDSASSSPLSLIMQARKLPNRLCLLGVLFLSGLLSFFQRGSNSTTVLINAAQMQGNTGRLGDNVQVVDL